MREFLKKVGRILIFTGGGGIKIEDFDIKNPYAGCTVIEEKKLMGARKVISNHLLSSYQTKVHATMHRYMEVGKLRVFIKEIGQGSIVDHFIRAVAVSLKELPDLNATFDGEVYRIFKNINICYAIETERGLVTPVLRDADTFSIPEFYNVRKQIIAKVLEWKHEIKDILGGTFTITNLGNFNADFLHPIINPPQVAILGMGRLCKQAISWDMAEPVREKELMPISITFDHRVIDGSRAAEFAEVLQKKISEPDHLWDTGLK